MTPSERREGNGGDEAGQLRAVIFDVDGTLVDSERHGHRVAFNQAFEELDLPYRWGEEEYGDLLRITGGKRRIEHYLADQGMEEEERGELAGRLHSRKSEILTELLDDGRLQPRPGGPRLLTELLSAGCTLAVVTTGSRSWVVHLLEKLFGEFHFDVVVTGDEVEERKPDPEAFHMALERLGLDAGRAVVVEDSAEGVDSAKAAGLACAVVVNGYTTDHDLDEADLVLDGFGEESSPARVIADRRDTGCGGVLDVATLRRLLDS